METIGLILGLLKISLEVFQDSRKDRYLERYLSIQRDFQDELNKGIDNWSDVKLNKLRIEAILLAELVIRERNKPS